MAQTILVIDDSASLRQVVAMALKGAGYTVLEAGDGVAALELLDGRKISMAVCDVNMPRMGGIEFIEEIFARGTPIPPVIMLTTEGHPKLIQRAKACGAKGWMIKPFKPEMLVAAARKLTTAA